MLLGQLCGLFSDMFALMHYIALLPLTLNPGTFFMASVVLILFFWTINIIFFLTGVPDPMPTDSYFLQHWFKNPGNLVKGYCTAVLHAYSVSR